MAYCTSTISLSLNIIAAVSVLIFQKTAESAISVIEDNVLVSFSSRRANAFMKMIITIADKL